MYVLQVYDVGSIPICSKFLALGFIKNWLKKKKKKKEKNGYKYRNI